MCNGKCTCGRDDKETSEKNISEDTAASYNNSLSTDDNGVVVD